MKITPEARIRKLRALHVMRRNSKPNPWPEIKGLKHQHKPQQTEN